MTATANGQFGRPTPRIDGRDKVTGTARFASDERTSNPAFAYLVTSSIAKGRVAGFGLDGARAVPGVLEILTHENVRGLVKPAPGPDGGPSTTTMEDDRVWHDGQIIAVVVAESFEAAREAANRVAVRYAMEQPSATFGSPGATVEPHRTSPAGDPKKGDAAAALAAAGTTIDARYSTPAQHHNPMELYTTTCVWDGPRLKIYEPTQEMWGTKMSVARQLGLDPDNVRAVCRYVGGAFGGKGPNDRTAWIAVAAKRLGRAVKLVPTRDQGFTIAKFRAETQHHIQLGAGRDGRLTALVHDGCEITSRPSKFSVAGVESTARMYACPNIATSGKLVHADRNTPGYMRAPSETPYMFALESAMDELAHALDMDPVELRRVNDTQTDPVSGLPFSSRSVMQCFDQAADRFGWSKRDKRPGSMRDGDWLVGFGCASACYPSNIGCAAARLSVMPNGKATISLAGHEIGNGAYTAVAMTVAGSLGLPVEDVTVVMGDSNLPPVIVAGGSSNAASTAQVAAKACEDVRRRLAEAAVGAIDSPLHGADPSTLQLSQRALRGPDGKSELLEAAIGRTGARLEAYAESVPAGLPPSAMARLYQGGFAMLFGGARKDVTAYSFGAHFVEVRVNARTREIRVPRIVSALAAGTIINPMAARSQFMSGAIWGMSAALMEETELDGPTARYINDNLADYMVPVNADVPAVDVIMVPEADDRVNPLSIKGIGEVGVVGMNAAIANAVFNATGKRVRDLPIRLEKLL